MQVPRSMINIMLLGSSLNFGGAERVIAYLAKYLDRDRFSVTVCHLKEGGVVGDELVAQGIRVVGVPCDTGRLKRYLSFIRLGDIVDALGIHLIHTHTTYALSDACLSGLLRHNGPKHVHTFHFGNYPNYPKRYRRLEFICSRLADNLVAVGHEQNQRIRATYRLPARRIRTIVNGVDSPEVAPDPVWQARLMERRKIVVGSICTFIEQKGLPDLLEVAMRICRERDDVVFVLVGDGPMREALVRRCIETGLADRVLFAGWMTEASSSILPLFDIFVQTSRWEAMSMVVLEAMAAAKPVVVTDVGDNRHVVLNEISGIVVSPGDTDGLRNGVCSLIDAPDKRDAFGTAGRARFLEQFTAQVMARAYGSLYLECLANGHADSM